MLMRKLSCSIAKINNFFDSLLNFSHVQLSKDIAHTLTLVRHGHRHFNTYNIQNVGHRSIYYIIMNYIN